MTCEPQDRRYASQRALDRIEEKVDNLSIKVDDLNTLRAEINGAVKFMKIMAGIVAGGAAAWAWIMGEVSRFKP